MNKTLLLSIILQAFITTVLSQEIIYIEYKDGKSQKEAVDNINKISFHHADELPPESITPDVSRGLLAYYTFDNETVNDTQNRFNGFTSSCSFISDSPNGNGKALFLKRGEEVLIPFAPIDKKRNFTISFWVKDFGAGCIFKSYNNYLYAPTLEVTENLRLKVYTLSHWDYSCTFLTDLSLYQSEKWNMITVVTKTEGKETEGICELYINGDLIESQEIRTSVNEGATTMAIGGYTSSWADPFKIDNIRLYDVALTKEEIVSIHNREKKPAIISISPQCLYFDKNTNKKSITITNNTLYLREFNTSCSNNMLQLSSTNGYVPAQKSKTIEVSIKDRDNIETYTKGNVTIEAEGMYYAIEVQIEKGNNAQKPSEEVSRGLQAYYNFDDGTAVDSRNGYTGIFDGGTLITDTPNGRGKALFLKKGEFVDIPYAPLDKKTNYSISLWVKDFGAGCLFKSYNDYLYAPSLIVTEEMRLKIYTLSHWDYSKTFNFNLSNYQSDKWTMMTVVIQTEGSDDEGTCKLYINGQRVDAGTMRTNLNSGAIKMSIGSDESDPFKIDNIRLYSVALTDDEVMEIFNAERQ